MFTRANDIQFRAPHKETIWGCKISESISQVIGPTVIPPKVLKNMTDKHINIRIKKELFSGFNASIKLKQKPIINSRPAIIEPPFTMSSFLPYF